MGKIYNAAINLKTAEYLQNKYTLPQTTEETLWIDARIYQTKI